MALAAFLSLTSLGCVASTDVEDVREIAGVWVASHAIYSELADPTNRFDLIAIGLDVIMDITPDGDWLLLISDETDVAIQTGTMSVDGKLLSIIDETGTNTGRAYLEGEQMAIQILGGLQQWDFDLDGDPEPAKLNLVMDRQQ